MEARPNITILGGGFAGLETAFSLRHELGDRVDLTLVSDRDHFTFKPNTIYIPFGEDPDRFRIPLDRPALRQEITFLQASVKEIDPVSKRVETDGRSLSYDRLVVATGAEMRPDEIPGLSEHAHTVWTPEDMLRLREGLRSLTEHARAGTLQRLLFLVPPNNRCAGPLYELAMMTDTWLRREKARDHVDIAFTTFEESFVQAFGPRLNTVVSEEFEERGILGLNGFVVQSVEADVVHFLNGEQRGYDLLISFPPYIARQRFAALPIDDRGFIHVEPDSRRVKGLPDVYSVGDAADFPIKQAFLALLQGGAAAAHLAAEVIGGESKLKFEPMSMCVMEELNKATFAQVPLKYTGDPLKPVAVDTDDTEDYKVGVSPVWRGGKKLLGLYLPWRFGRGEPFHAGFAWDAMDLGLKLMSKAFAR